MKVPFLWHSLVYFGGAEVDEGAKVDRGFPRILRPPRLLRPPIGKGGRSRHFSTSAQKAAEVG